MSAPPHTFTAEEKAKVADLAYNGSSYREIGSILGVDGKTVKEHFRRVIDYQRALRRSELRKTQTDLAKDKNVVMLIWLGKQELGQQDKQEKTIRRRDITRIIGGSRNSTGRTNPPAT